MSHAALQSLRIQSDAADPELARQQTRFNALVGDVALWRASLAGWKERMERFRQAVEPERRELHAAWRQWTFALDHASLQPGLARAEREQLDELLLEAATALLEWEDDAEIATVASRHRKDPSSGPSRPEDGAHEAGDQEPLDDMAEAWERQASAAAAQREERAARRLSAAASKRREQAAREVSGSLREVYRRLASALHPDREPDSRQRDRKTVHMQRANRAYEEGNLLALLELQLQAEQLDAAHLALADPRRLRHYVTVLEEQLADLQAETRRLEADFRAATGVAPGSGLQPRKADRLISSETQRLRGELQLLRRQTALLADIEATKSWLREQRKG